MKYQKRQEWKKKTIAGVAIVIALIMIMSLLAPFAYGMPQAVAMDATTGVVQTGDDDDPVLELDVQKTQGEELFDVDLQVGFLENGKNAYIINQFAPVLGTITNHGGAFTGELQVRTYIGESSQGLLPTSSVLYYQELELAQGASKRIEMEASMSSFFKFVDVSLVNSAGETVYFNRLNLQPKDPGVTAVAVLSDRSAQLQYLAKMQLQAGYNQTTVDQYNMTTFLDEDLFPSSKHILNNFTVIIIDSFDTRNLSAEQVDALEAWVQDGGVLVLGTGAQAQNVLAGLPFLSGVSVTGTSTISDAKVYSGEGVLAGEMTVANLKGNDLQTVWSQEGQALATTMPYALGKILLMNFSFSLSPVAGNGLSQEMIKQLILQTAFPNGIMKDESGSRYQSVEYLAAKFPALEGTSVNIIIGIICGYILLVGPILYFILKKKDKRERAWVVIPVVSVLGMVLVFFMAGNSGYKDGILHTVGVVQMHPETTHANADFGISFKSSKKGDVTFTGTQETGLFPSDLSENMLYGYYSSKLDKNGDLYRIQVGDEAKITFPASDSWETNTLSGEKLLDLGGNVEINLTIKDNKYVGTVTNGTTVNFDHATIFIGNQGIEIDGIYAGQTADIEVAQDLAVSTSYFDVYDYYSINDVRQAVRVGQMSSQDGYNRFMQYQLVNNTIDGNQRISTQLSGGISNNIQFFGFSSQSIMDEEMHINAKAVPESTLVGYCQTFELDYSTVEKFTLALQPDVESTTGLDVYYYGEGFSVLYPYEANIEVPCVYVLPKGTEVSSIYLGKDIEAHLLAEGYQIFNQKIGEWQTVELGKRLDADAYTDADGNITVKVSALKDMETQIPKLFVEGRGLNAGN